MNLSPRRFPTAAIAVATGLLCVLFASPSSAATDESPLNVPLVSSGVDVDGVLDEPVWSRARRLELTYEVEPGDNIPPPVKTAVLIAYDTNRLLVAFVADDPDPGSIRARISDRDGLYDDDWVSIVLDTFNDQRRSFTFFCNPLGVQADGVETSTSGVDISWDAIWESAGRITAEGYVVEMAIPFCSLRFQQSEGDQIWGFDAVRLWPRQDRHKIGLVPRDRDNDCYLCQTAAIVGFSGAAPGHNLEIDPTFSMLWTDQRYPFPGGDFHQLERRREPGITARWGFTPNLTLAATANPDFSQVEADAAQLEVNTPFTLFYPEKRPFFMEGADYFTSRLRAVHTRTLLDPVWGTKVAGKEGADAVGAFFVRDDKTRLLFPGPESSSVRDLDRQSSNAAVRWRRDLGGASQVGLIATDRESGNYSNRMAGADASIRLTRSDRLQVQWLASRTDYPEDISRAFGQSAEPFSGQVVDVLFNHGTRDLDVYGVFRDVDDEFRADLGFMPQVGHRFWEGGADWTWRRRSGSWFNLLSLGAAGFRQEKSGGEMLLEAGVFEMNYRGPSQSYCWVSANLGRRGFRGREFDDDHVEFEAGILPNGWLALSVEGDIGDGIDVENVEQGNRIMLRPMIEARLGRHLSVVLDHAYERMRENGEHLYTDNLSQARLVWQLDRRTFLRAILQYEDLDRNPSLYPDYFEEKQKALFTQLLFSYKLNPQTVFFLGYSDNRYGDQDIDLTRGDRTIFMKIGYAWMI